MDYDCEDQGHSLISDGCIKCQSWDPGATKPTRPALVKEAHHGRLWWTCPKCHGSYGDAGPTTEQLVPAKKCPDYDDDCLDVHSHIQCWKGLKAEREGVIFYTGPADGYCPFVVGQQRTLKD